MSTTTLREANWRKAKRLLAQVPTIIADLHRVRSGQPLLSPDPKFGISANFLYMLRGTPPNELEIKAMEMLMVLLADHPLNASTFTARVVASTLSDMHSALSAAIGALKGPLHGGANQKVMEMILNIPNVAMVEAYIAGMLENKQKIMGFGRHVYRTEDPRTQHLFKYSDCYVPRTTRATFTTSHGASSKLSWMPRASIRTLTSTPPRCNMP